MPYRGLERDPLGADLLIDFGRILRAGRRRASYSQMRLEAASGVDQTSISRLETGKAPALGVVKLARIASVLGRSLPLGFCPHEHACTWQPPPLMRPRSSAGLIKPRNPWEIWDRTES